MAILAFSSWRDTLSRKGVIFASILTNITSNCEEVVTHWLLSIENNHMKGATNASCANLVTMQANSDQCTNKMVSLVPATHKLSNVWMTQVHTATE